MVTPKTFKLHYSAASRCDIVRESMTKKEHGFSRKKIGKSKPVTKLLARPVVYSAS